MAKQTSKAGATKRIRTALKRADIYAKPIHLTYQGQDKFRSSCGGLLSLVVILLIVSLFVYNLRDLVNRSNS